MKEDEVHAVKEQPQFQHDCDTCRFLGRYTYDAKFSTDVRPVSVDLYVCRANTFIARYGDEGQYYSSFDRSTLELSDILVPGRLVSTYTTGVIEAYHRCKRGA